MFTRVDLDKKNQIFENFEVYCNFFQNFGMPELFSLKNHFHMIVNVTKDDFQFILLPCEISSTLIVNDIYYIDNNIKNIRIMTNLVNQILQKTTINKKYINLYII